MFENVVLPLIVSVLGSIVASFFYPKIWGKWEKWKANRSEKQARKQISKLKEELVEGAIYREDTQRYTTFVIKNFALICYAAVTELVFIGLILFQIVSDRGEEEWWRIPPMLSNAFFTILVILILLKIRDYTLKLIRISHAVGNPDLVAKEIIELEEKWGIEGDNDKTK